MSSTTGQPQTLDRTTFDLCRRITVCQVLTSTGRRKIQFHMLIQTFPCITFAKFCNLKCPCPLLKFILLGLKLLITGLLSALKSSPIKRTFRHYLLTLAPSNPCAVIFSANKLWTTFMELFQSFTDCGDQELSQFEKKPLGKFLLNYLFTGFGRASK